MPHQVVVHERQHRARQAFREDLSQNDGVIAPGLDVVLCIGRGDFPTEYLLLVEGLDVLQEKQARAVQHDAGGKRHEPLQCSHHWSDDQHQQWQAENQQDSTNDVGQMLFEALAGDLENLVDAVVGQWSPGDPCQIVVGVQR